MFTTAPWHLQPQLILRHSAFGMGGLLRNRRAAIGMTAVVFGTLWLLWYCLQGAGSACLSHVQSVCFGARCDRGICWARSVAAMGPTGVPTPFDALGFGGAISWVRMSRAAADVPTPQQLLRQTVENALADTQPDQHTATAAELTSAGLHSWANPASQSVQVGRATIDFSSNTGAIVGFTTNTGQGKVRLIPLAQ